MRELKPVAYDGNLESDKLLYKHDMLPPDKLSSKLTYLYGKRTNRLPLLFATEGQDNVTSKKPKSRSLNDTQYTWPIMGNYKFTDEVVKLITNTTEPGRNGTDFEVAMRTNYIPPQYTVRSPDKQYQCLVLKEPRIDSATNSRIYTLRPMWTNPDDHIPMENFIEGKHWSMGAPVVAPRRSEGNRFNSMFPGELTNQFGFKRYSMEITGNITNKMTPYEMDVTVKNAAGKEKTKTTKYYLPFQMTQFEMTRKELDEESLWHDTYNRDENGIISLKDDNGEEIPQGAGIIEQIKFVNNYETYYKLTPKRIQNIIERIRQASNKVDYKKEYVIYTGKGGIKEWHNALESDAMTKGFLEAVGEKYIREGENGFLEYGNGFKHFKMYDGTLVSVEEVELFNSGSRAQSDEANGRISEDGFPWESYNMAFIDHSTYDGERNIMMVREQGREFFTGVYNGMTPLPGEWEAITKANRDSKHKLLSTTKDMASYEVMESLGIAMKNPTSSFYLEYKPE